MSQHDSSMEPSGDVDEPFNDEDFYVGSSNIDGQTSTCASKRTLSRTIHQHVGSAAVNSLIHFTDLT